MTLFYWVFLFKKTISVKFIVGPLCPRNYHMLNYYDMIHRVH